jgi:excinuclease ABC subunit C
MTEFFKNLLKNFPNAPGIYRMLGENKNVLYVGKAKNLKKRVGSYFNREAMDAKTRHLVKRIHDIEITITPSEKEALILESNLIKKLQPPYNILFRDDKSYPYLMLTHHTQFPRLAGVRTKSLKNGDYFGPYPSMHSLKDTMNLMHKVFKLRSCSDAYFNNRTRPCLEYQIKRCSAPCVGFINSERYLEDVQHVKDFLKGKSQRILHELGNAMEQEANLLHFEEAARLRDQLKNLRELQERQIINTTTDLDADVITVAREHLHFCVEVLYVRSGNILGQRVYFVEGQEFDNSESILGAFIDHYYFTGFGQSSVPKEIIIENPLELSQDLLDLFKTEHGRVPKILAKPKGLKKRWLEMAKINARDALSRQILMDARITERLLALQTRLKLNKIIERIECFDISHSMGEAIVASCVVFDENGANKKAYRRFNIEGITPGDDYAAMHQVLLRRFKRLRSEEQAMPDLVLIDGGKGQLSEALKVFNELDVQGVQLMGVAKGPERKAGKELLWLPEHTEPLILDPHDPAFLLIQEVRNEAHRFAITGHRKQRAKKLQGSVLDDIPGIGAKRRQAILKYFGGWQEVRKASLDELAKVPGVSRALAKTIHQVFNA